MAEVMSLDELLIEFGCGGRTRSFLNYMLQPSQLRTNIFVDRYCRGDGREGRIGGQEHCHVAVLCGSLIAILRLTRKAEFFSSLGTLSNITNYVSLVSSLINHPYLPRPEANRPTDQAKT